MDALSGHHQNGKVIGWMRPDFDRSVTLRADIVSLGVGRVCLASVSETAGSRCRSLMWRHAGKLRVHALYDSVQTSLGRDFTYDRSGKQTYAAVRAEKAGIDPAEVPEPDILKVERDGTLVAIVKPRGLWIVGANGRVDMILVSRAGRRRGNMSQPVQARLRRPDPVHPTPER